jgi:hypothetical protein
MTKDWYEGPELNEVAVDRVDSHAGREEELLPRRIAARRALADDTDSINQYDQVSIPSA